MPKRKVNKVKNLRLREVSLVDEGANTGAKVVLAKAKDGKTFKACDDCKTPGACAKAGRCAAEMHKSADQADADLAAAVIEATEEINKAAKSFKDVFAASEDRNKLWRMYDALMSSVSSIINDPEVKDKAKQVRDSVKEFSEALSEEFGDVKKKTDAEANAAAGGDGGAGGSGSDHDKETQMSKDKDGQDKTPANGGDDEKIAKMVGDAVTKALEPVLQQNKTLTEELNKMKGTDEDRAAREAVQGLTVPGMDTEALAKAYKALPADQREPVLKSWKATSEAMKKSTLFQEIGKSAAPAGNVDESPIVKRAKKSAEALNKQNKAA